ncbi:hypothetical protein PCANC_08803 [Puccinia coronata f. sp. avenae]|uniref:Uncharacterized protein n=1 Tax=Puccinia coronata f. sp. avenae TaxID=200324 RepID=A0A2N5V885_9BASI|nr:hypothetical protein PCANC_08803 [Puccinia coronata f. sp. avenae]
MLAILCFVMASPALAAPSMAKDKNGLRLGQQKGTTKSATGSTDPHSVDEAAELDYVMISPATGEALGTSQFRLSDHTLFLNHFSAHSLSAKDVNGAANVKPSANESKLDKRAIIPSLPALTGRTRQFERCSNSRVRPVVGQALSDRSTCRRVGQACPISSWDRLHRTSRDRSDKSVRPVGSRFGRTVSVRPPVEHGCSSTARAAVFDRLMPAVPQTVEERLRTTKRKVATERLTPNRSYPETTDAPTLEIQGSRIISTNRPINRPHQSQGLVLGQSWIL